MTPFLTGGDDAATVWSRLQASSGTPRLLRNGATDQQDAIIHYIYEVFKDQEPNGRQAMTPLPHRRGSEHRCRCLHSSQRLRGEINANPLARVVYHGAAVVPLSP